MALFHLFKLYYKDFSWTKKQLMLYSFLLVFPALTLCNNVEKVTSAAGISGTNSGGLTFNRTGCIKVSIADLTSRKLYSQLPPEEKGKGRMRGNLGFIEDDMLFTIERLHDRLSNTPETASRSYDGDETIDSLITELIPASRASSSSSFLAGRGSRKKREYDERQSIQAEDDDENQESLPWKCKKRVVPHFLGDDYLPRTINKVECKGKSKCFHGFYECRVKKSKISVLQKQQLQVCLYHEGEDGSISLLHLWKPVERLVPTSCECGRKREEKNES